MRNRLRKQKGGNCFAAVIIPDQVHTESVSTVLPGNPRLQGILGSKASGLVVDRGWGVLKSYSKNVAPPTGEHGQQCVEGRGTEGERE